MRRRSGAHGSRASLSIRPQLDAATFGLIRPKVNAPDFDPGLDRTNAANRALLKSSLNIAPHFSPKILLYREGAVTRLGANLTATLGQRVVAYLGKRHWSTHGMFRPKHSPCR